ncbi:MAG: hypothetical protein IJL26_12055 [Clostridia bacterium]|nr:hypothetical protein [Clostridia bacterium]
MKYTHPKANTAAQSRDARRTRPCAGDVAALIAFVCLAGFLLYFARRQFAGTVDEDFYYTIPQRLLMGDRLLVDEWQVSQLSALFQLLPYHLFTKITGGNDGIILFMKLVFVAVDLILYWYFYIRLRKYSVWAAAAAAFLFCADPHMGMEAFSYYTMTPQCVALIGVWLLTSERELSRPKLVFAGVLFACAVLLVPSFAAIWLGFCILVLLRERTANRTQGPLFDRYGFVLNRRTWLWSAVGVVFCAAAFAVYLLSDSGGLRVLAENLRGMFASEDHDLSLGSVFEKPLYYPMFVYASFGAVNTAAMLLVTAACAVFRLRARKKKTAAEPRVKAVLLLLTLAVDISCILVSAGIVKYFVTFTGKAPGTLPFAEDIGDRLFFCLSTSTVPTYFLALNAYLLNQKKDRRMTAFLLLTVACSVCNDLIANGSFLSGGRAAIFPAVYFAADTLREARDDFSGRKRNAGTKSPSRAVRTVAAILAAALCCGAVCAKTGFSVLQACINVHDRHGGAYGVFESGPYRGLVSSPNYIDQYEQFHENLDVIKANCDGAFFVAGYFAYCYLYLDLPFGTYSAFMARTEPPEHWQLYWELHPEKKPQYVFLPTVNDDLQPDEERRLKAEENLEYFRSVCSFERTDIDEGYILRVTDWKI